MIAWNLIVAAALATAASVAVSARVLRWSGSSLLVAAAGALLMIVAWRALANLLHWNDDFLPMISIGDMGCLLAGAAAPAAMGLRREAPPPRLIPAIVGGVVGFAVNVLIL